MKFSKMPYKRPDMTALRSQLQAIAARIENATDADEQIKAYDEFNAVSTEVVTTATICEIRHTIDTSDEFYDAENDFFDENAPVLTELSNLVSHTLLASRFREQLEKHYGKLLFDNLEISVRAFKPELAPLMQQENALVSEYQKLYASLTVEWEGETLPLPKLGPFKTSPDREVRKAAYTKEGEAFDAQRDRLDSIFTKLVLCRNAQARLLGHDNYIQLGYDRLGRNCYGYNELRTYREQIARDIVPVVRQVKQLQRERIGVDSLLFYDDAFHFTDGNAKPKGTTAQILDAGRKMYRELSAETAEFIDHMYDNELLDVESKRGKAPGGYSTELPKYKAAFIFSNFNGTAADVDVLTHEAGHAFAAYRAYKKGYIPEYIAPTIEACEVHSMSMEFLTSAYHELFFRSDTKKYAFYHCADAICFIPYGCMVDEFQHIMYENENLTPQERNEKWLELEKKYRPYIDFDNLPFYSRGAGWQRQLHIYQCPLYYIDYCMAQTVAFQFWLASMKDFDDAFRRYLAFVDAGGTATFEQLVEKAGMLLPYADGTMKNIAREISGWLKKNAI